MHPLSLGSNQSQHDLLLVKDNLAAYFREEIITGRLATGEKIVEIKVVQGSQNPTHGSRGR